MQQILEKVSLEIRQVSDEAKNTDVTVLSVLQVSPLARLRTGAYMYVFTTAITSPHYWTVAGVAPGPQSARHCP